jgi:hypothetical protein
MATLVLSTVGNVVGTALGGPFGGAIGQVIGAVSGSLIDKSLSAPGQKTRVVQGPRLADVSGLSSTEGDPIPRLYGRARIGGTLIWATRPLEVANTTVQRAAAPSKGTSGPKTAQTTYAYYANLAVGLCEGEIAFVRRIWADGREIDQTQITLRVHPGTPDQAPDPLIVAKEGVENAPAYRGLAYIVFEQLPLADYGNRIPQFTFEVIRPVNGLCEAIRAVDLIPGAGEFIFDPHTVTVDFGFGRSGAANRNQLRNTGDVVASLDALQALCPNLRRVAVVATWFGTDLRAAQCRIAPKTEIAAKRTTGDVWRVGSLTREAAATVSTLADGTTPAFGGTPSDAGIQRLFLDLSSRGLEIVLYPFVMMDVPPGNALPDPHRPGATQPAYPWRGRITCDPAPGQPGSPDGTDAAARQVAAFFDNGFRDLVLHYADLAADWVRIGAPVKALVIGSELLGLTRVRDATGYPAVAALRTLAAQVRDRLGSGVALLYAADWTEYGAHVRDGGRTVRFPLDDLFADPAIAAVGIDWYPPVTDWRDTPGHADLALADDIYDRAYLKARGTSGEAFEWFYADEAARAAQARTPITDGAAGKPWIYRPKDLVAWWSSRHVERDDGVETRATAWVPMGKPIWLTEVGVPAVDKGTNGPNVFPDPKSSENALPPESRGTRDDLIQLRGLGAILARFDPAAPGFAEADNPVSPVYGGRMVDPASIFVWCWDARPYPAFSDLTSAWADAGNWRLGHWITGRIEGCDLDLLVARILADFGFDGGLSIRAAAFLDGYVIDRPMSARGALEGLAQVYGLDVSAVGGTLTLRGPRRDAAIVVPADDLVRVSEEAGPVRRVRAEEGSLPRSLEIGITDSESLDYRRASAAALRPAGGRRGETRIETAIVTRRELGDSLAEEALDRLIAARESAVFTLSPRRQDLEPGDLVAVPSDPPGTLVRLRIQRIDDSPAGRRVEASGIPPRLGPPLAVGRTPAGTVAPPPAFAGAPFAIALDLPVDRGSPSILQYLAVAAEPWPGSVSVWRAEAAGAFALHGSAAYPACLGRTLAPLPPGPLWRLDHGASLPVTLRRSEALGSIGLSAMLAGGNLFAVVAPGGMVEILSAATAAATGQEAFLLSGFLRGLAGSEAAASQGAPAGSLIVRLDDGGVGPLVAHQDEAGRTFRYRIGPAGLDPGDPAMAELSAAAGLSAVTPLRPVHLRARRSGGDVLLSWMRRARRSADAWEPADIPLDEPSERYAVTVYAGAAPVRALTATGPGLLYPAAAEAADFGRAQTVLDVAVAQIGAVSGAGPATRARLPVRSA